MSGFVGFTPHSVVVITSDGREDTLVHEVHYTSCNGTYRIPKGATTDGLSIPWCAQWVVPAAGHASWLAGVLHDAAYRGYLEQLTLCGWEDANLTRKEADDLFLEAMEAQRVSRPLRWAMWAVVRLLGRADWIKQRGTA